jgi:hypothetical protein
LKKSVNYFHIATQNGILNSFLLNIISSVKHLDNIASDQNVLNLEIVENNPTRVSGISGFKAIYTYKNKDGLKIKSIYYGFIADKWFYGLNYNAAQRFYFDKDVQTFEKVVESFKLIKTA